MQSALMKALHSVLRRQARLNALILARRDAFLHLHSTPHCLHIHPRLLFADARLPLHSLQHYHTPHFLLDLIMSSALDRKLDRAWDLLESKQGPRGKDLDQLWDALDDDEGYEDDEDDLEVRCVFSRKRSSPSSRDS